MSETVSNCSSVGSRDTHALPSSVFHRLVSMSYGELWLLFFIYTCICAIVVKAVLLPWIFPSWHAGDGLMIGGDWLLFDDLAVDLSEKIRSVGWGAWVLRPGSVGQGPAGIAAALYALIRPSSFVLVPVHAALHASSALILVLILRLIGVDKAMSVCGSMPFLVFPTAMLWYTQIHKNGYAILGVFFMLYGFSLAVDALRTDCQSWKGLQVAFYLLLGSATAFIVRPYLVRMIQTTLLVILIPVIFVLLPSIFHQRQLLYQRCTMIIILCLVLLIITPLGRSTSKTATFALSADSHAISQRVSMEPVFGTHIDSIFMRFAIVREGSIRTGGRTTIDAHVRFRNPWDVIHYAPRALFIGLFAPFPSHWFGSGSQAANTVMRRVAALEGIVIYMSLFGLIFTAWRHRLSPLFWLAVAFSLILILAYSLGIANIGSLYRVKYPYLMLLVALGIPGLIHLFYGILYARLKG